MLHKKLVLLSFLFLLVFAFAISASADDAKFINVSLFNPIQIVPEGEAIKGVRLNLLYGKNSYVSGLDFGLVNHTTSGLTKGYQFGLVGITESDFMGFQDNAINIVSGNCEGFQWGIVNHTNNMNGFQLGIVNYARNMHGLQIGLINIIKQNGQFPVFPIVNWSF